MLLQKDAGNKDDICIKNLKIILEISGTFEESEHRKIETLGPY